MRTDELIGLLAQGRQRRATRRAWWGGASVRRCCWACWPAWRSPSRGWVSSRPRVITLRRAAVQARLRRGDGAGRGLRSFASGAAGRAHRAGVRGDGAGAAGRRGGGRGPWLATPQELRAKGLLGHPWWDCPWFVLTICAAALARCWRCAASRRRARAAASRPPLAGRSRALAYALACTEMAMGLSPPGTIGILMVGALGAAGAACCAGSDGPRR